VRIPFLRTPRPCKRRQRILSPEEFQFLEEEVKRMLRMNAIREMKPEEAGRSVRSSIYTVPKKNGKRRAVINLRWLNSHVNTEHFKMTSMKDVKSAITPGCWMASLDLSDCFWGLPVSPDHQRFLAFDFEGKTYCFQVLPFGLGPSPWFITKLYRHVVERLQQQGHQVMMYIDDMLILGEDKRACEAAVEAARDLLQELGAVLNEEKSSLSPSQKLVYLGFEIDSEAMTITAPPKKLTNLRKAIRSVLKKPASARCLASILGKINSLQDAMLATRIHTTELHEMKLALAEKSWDYKAPLTKEAIQDLEWWKCNASDINGKSLLPPVVDVRAATDASDYGWGAWMETPTGIQRWGGVFSSSIAKEHINYKELLTVWYALRSAPVDLKNKTLEIGIDNTTAMWYLRKSGGSRRHLAKLSETIWLWLLQHKVTLRVFHLPGVLNTIADEESRLRNKIRLTDLALNHSIFNKICYRWGTPTIDLFATFQNRQVPRFASELPQPGAVWVDAMRHSWSKERAWANPPFALIGRVLQKVRAEKTSVILVAPLWPAQPWFASLLAMLTDVPMLLPRSNNLFQHPILEKRNESMNPVWATAVWRISGDASVQRDARARLSRLLSRHGTRALTSRMTLLGRPGVTSPAAGSKIRALETHLLSGLS
jgi:hypothetical protein